MALNLPDSDANSHRQPIIKYDSRAGRIFRVDRSDASGQWVSTPVEITPVFQAVIDLENVETGWLHFPTGGAPDIRTVKLGQALPDRPTDKHRQGFRVLLLLGKQSGGDVREMAANAQVSIKGMNALHDAYEAGLRDNPGMLPVIKLAGTIPVTTTGKANGQAVSSTNYQPIWQIVKWVPRPPELSPQALAAQQQHQPAPAPQPVQQVAPPPVQPAPAPQPVQPVQPVLASVDDDF